MPPGMIDTPSPCSNILSFEKEKDWNRKEVSRKVMSQDASLLDTSLTCGNSMRLKINPCVFQQVPEERWKVSTGKRSEDEPRLASSS